MLKSEDIIHKQFASLITMYEKLGKLNANWWSYDASGENRNPSTGALLKAKGLHPGQSDYKFKVVRDDTAHYFYLEFKSEKGKQSENQKRFQSTCFAGNEKYSIARSVREGVEWLLKEQVIKE